MRLNNEIGKNTQEVDEDLSLGQYLLSGLMYEGFLDFHDSIAMKTVEQTIGGFDLISLYFDDAPCDRKQQPIALTA